MYHHKGKRKTLPKKSAKKKDAIAREGEDISKKQYSTKRFSSLHANGRQKALYRERPNSMLTKKKESNTNILSIYEQLVAQLIPEGSERWLMERSPSLESVFQEYG